MSRLFSSAMALLLVSSSAIYPVAAKSDKKAKRQAVSEATHLVNEALSAEAQGDLAARQKLFAQAANLTEIEAAKWHSGYVKSDAGQWLTVDESIKQASNDKKLVRYETIRAQAADSSVGQMQLAVWCIQNGMLDQARSHLNVVLQKAPDNAQAKLALGYQLVSGKWITPGEVQQFERRSAATKQSYDKFGKEIRTIVRNLESGNVRIRQAAREAIVKLNDPEAVPAIEAVFNQNLHLAETAVNWLSSIDSVGSSQVLAKYALLHDKPEIRLLATEALKYRPLHDFVPDLLAMMATPISTSLVPMYDERGEVEGYSQAFTQEKFDRKEVVSYNKKFQTSGRRSTGQRFVESQLELALNPETQDQASLQQTATTEDVRNENNRVEERNFRIGNLIAAVGNTSYNNDAKQMWGWWDEYNETAYQEFKPERYESYNEEYQVLDSDDDDDDGNSGECFVEGTLIVTNRGMKAIDTIVAGDLVLSRNIASGALEWKPVLRATRRPPEATRILTVRDDRLQCTTGHLLWVSGSGWKKASELKKGDILHGAKEPIVLDNVVEAPDAATFNLDVADNGTYFVGKSMIMSHDVKPRSANREIVPGLRMVSTTAKR